MTSNQSFGNQSICNVMLTKRISVKSTIPGFFAFTALILAWVSQFTYDFFHFTSTNESKGPVSLRFGIWNYQYWTTMISSSFDYDDNFSYGYGFYRVEEATGIDEQREEEIHIFVYDWNHPYPDAIEVDSYWRASRAFGITSLTLGSVLVLNRFYFFLACPENRIPVIIEMIGCFACCLFQGLSLLILKSDACDDNYMLKEVKDYFPENCEMGAGAKCTIAAVAFWFLAAISSHPYEGMKIHQDLPDEEEGDRVQAEPGN